MAWADTIIYRGADIRKGRLLYETPKTKRGTTALVVGTYVLYVLVVAFLLWSGVFWQESLVGTVLLSVFVPLVLFIIFSIIASRRVDTPFRIYEDGLTVPLSEILFAFRKEGRFLPYSDVKAFETSPRGQRAILYLRQNKRVHYASRDRSVMRTLRKELLDHGVREVQDTCPKCGNRVYGPFCPECGARRF